MRIAPVIAFGSVVSNFMTSVNWFWGSTPFFAVPNSLYSPPPRQGVSWIIIIARVGEEWIVRRYECGHIEPPRASFPTQSGTVICTVVVLTVCPCEECAAVNTSSSAAVLIATNTPIPRFILQLLLCRDHGVGKEATRQGRAHHRRCSNCLGWPLPLPAPAGALLLARKQRLLQGGEPVVNDS